MDFKVTYLDAGLTSSYFSDGETPPSNGSATPANASTGNAKVPKRYKAHLRDFLSSCRGRVDIGLAGLALDQGGLSPGDKWSFR